ncbi:SDR family oxidoreductase [Duganella aceris]|uniref:SDR family oxidoreductase n=1 Tax=Duganella aceris TaxID=2703883 RepID=A0ABX0FFQ7_9BURK|nr:SDR family oxidoreductase [Duganella aceris]NGZ83383.1 SDR family oxidoreductase [Duganella aceris]
MRIFVTGATGFIGSAIIEDLIQAGHQVLGLARNAEAAALLERRGIAAHLGDVSAPDSVAAAARLCDGVIHTAFIHNFADIAASGRIDLAAVQAMGEALAGSGKPLVVTSGTAVLPAGVEGHEDDATDPQSAGKHRIPSEQATLALAACGVRASVLRLPPSVHGDGDHGFVPALIATARATGVSAYTGDGDNRWPAVHRLDAARLFRLVLEHGAAGACYHAAAEDGVRTKEIAEVIARRLNLPLVAKSADEANAHFGWLAHFFGRDCPASSAQTRRELDWRPSHAGLIADLDRPAYFQ